MKILGWLKQKRYMILAFIIYIITSITLYMVEYRIYGGAIDTNFTFSCIIYPISYFIGLVCRDHDKPIEKKEVTIWTKIGAFMGNMILCLCTIFFIYLLYKNIYELLTYHYLAIIIILVILYCSKKLDKYKQINSIPVIIIFGTFLITTFLYLIILNPFTVKDATLKVQNYGYSDVSYKNNIEDNKALSRILGKEFAESSKYEDNLGYYLFQGEKDEKDYAIVVSVTKGTIVVFEEVKSNTAIYYYLNW